MTIIQIILAVLALWYFCGIFNIAIVQGAFGDDDFSLYNRSTTIWLCYGAGPIMTTLIFAYGITIKPIKYGTRLGRFIGRKLEDILE